MKSRIIFMCIFLTMLIALAGYAQTVYYWKDEKGVMNATTTPPPDKIKKYDVDSYSKDSKAEIEQYQRQEEQKARAQEAVNTANQRKYQAEESAKRQQAQQQQTQQQQRKTQSESQDARNREADKLEAAASGLSPGRKAEMLTNAARIRLGQEPVPHTPEPFVDTPPPIDLSPKRATVKDPKTGKRVTGWTTP